MKKCIYHLARLDSLSLDVQRFDIVLCFSDDDTLDTSDTSDRTSVVVLSVFPINGNHGQSINKKCNSINNKM